MRPIEVFDLARAQLPELPAWLPRLVRADTAGATHNFLNHVVALEQRPGEKWQFSVGFAITEPVRTAIRALDDADWTAATRQNGECMPTSPTVSRSARSHLTPGCWTPKPS